jgi:hypothetical protein
LAFDCCRAKIEHRRNDCAFFAGLDDGQAMVVEIEKEIELLQRRLQKLEAPVGPPPSDGAATAGHESAAVSMETMREMTGQLLVAQEDKVVAGLYEQRSSLELLRREGHEVAHVSKELAKIDQQLAAIHTSDTLRTTHRRHRWFWRKHRAYDGVDARVPYSRAVCTRLEAFLHAGHSQGLVDVDSERIIELTGWGPDDPPDARTATQRRRDNRLRRREVVWELEHAAEVTAAADSSPPPEGVPGLVLWFWADDSAAPLRVQDKFVQYSDVICERLEKGYQETAARVDIGSGRHVDMQNKEHMLQVVTATPSRRRIVRRQRPDAEAIGGGGDSPGRSGHFCNHAECIQGRSCKPSYRFPEHVHRRTDLERQLGVMPGDHIFYRGAFNKHTKHVRAQGLLTHDAIAIGNDDIVEYGGGGTAAKRVVVRQCCHPSGLSAPCDKEC